MTKTKTKAAKERVRDVVTLTVNWPRETDRRFREWARESGRAASRQAARILEAAMNAEATA